MADQKPSKPSTVEVRVIAKRPFPITFPDGSRKEVKFGDVLAIDRKLFEADREPDRGMGRPAHGRAFALISEERAAEEKKEQRAKTTQDRISAMRESVRESEASLDHARATARTMEAENAKKIAESVTAPLDRTGARRVA